MELTYSEKTRLIHDYITTKNIIPTVQDVSNYQGEWKKRNRNTCGGYEDTLHSLMENNKSNKDNHKVLIKCSFINTMFSTRIQGIDIYDIAYTITESKEFDDYIDKGDFTAVNIIRQSTTKDNYAFATKYCAMHNPKKYPIYDSISVFVLYAFALRDNFYSIPTQITNIYGFMRYLRNTANGYEIYKEIYDSFIKYYKLQLDYRKTDKYLWALGKIILA